ncbi:MAG: vitamin K epoxide reductase family protein [Parcubacteria group bacterium]
MSPRVLKWILVLVSFGGILDAGYLTMQHYIGFSLSCSVLEGCNVVTQSSYSVVFGIPLALAGLIYYIVAFFFAVGYARHGSPNVLYLLYILTMVGFVFSLILVYLQLFVIDAVCIYCMMSVVSTTVLLLTAITLRKKIS